MSRRLSLPLLAVVTLVAAALAQAQVQPATTITLEVGEGPHQGSYRAISDEVTCSYGYAGEGLWGNQYSIDAADPDTFSSLQLIVDARAAATGTSEFLATVSFGQFFTEEETSYTVNSRSRDEGAGTVTLDDRGNGATVRIAAVSRDGIPFEATIECHQVLRAGPSRSELAEEEEEESEPAGALGLNIGDQSFDFTPTVDEAYCSEALAEERDFQYNYYPTESDGGITGLELYLYDSARLGGDAQFNLVIYDEEDGYYVDTSEGVDEGSGTVSLEVRGDIRTVTVSAITAEGLPLQVRLECRAE